MIRARIDSLGNVTFEVEESNEAELFKSIARVQSTFVHRACGCCKDTNIRFVSRFDSSKNEWLEMRCQSCFATLPYSKKRDDPTVIYPKIRWDDLSPTQKENRADQEAKCVNGYLPDGGWFKYKKA